MAYTSYKDLESAIDNEGEGYFLLHYTSSSEMPDEECAKLFDEAADAMKKFFDHVSKKANQED